MAVPYPNEVIRPGRLKSRVRLTDGLQLVPSSALRVMVSGRGLGRVSDAAAIVASPVDAQAVAELVALASRVAGGIRPVGSVRSAVGPVGPCGPAGPGRRLDRRDGGRTGPDGEPSGGSSVPVGSGRGQDGGGTAARGLRPVGVCGGGATTGRAYRSSELPPASPRTLDGR
jgi:hypothetical protein